MMAGEEGGEEGRRSRRKRGGESREEDQGEKAEVWEGASLGGQVGICGG